MRYFFILLISITPFLILSQGAYNYSFYFEKGYYQEAEKLLTRIKQPNTKELTDLSVSYYLQHKYKQALETIERIDKSEIKNNTTLAYMYPQLLRIQGKYSDAENWISIESEKNGLITWPQANQTNFGSQLTITDFLKTNEQYLGGAINAKNKTVYLPKQIKDSKNELVYYRIHTNTFDTTNTTNSWKSTVTESPKQAAYESNPSISSNGTIYLSMPEHDYYRIKPKKFKQEDSEHPTNNLGIYTYKNNSFESLGTSINILNTNSSHPCIINDNLLIFTSDKNGNFDLFMSKKSGEIWSEPVPLKINTNSDECFPVYYENYLYFSSRGGDNYGGLDIFRIKADPNSDSFITGLKAENLMMPVNSTFDDIMVGFSNSKLCYIATNRNVSGGDEIYYTKLAYNTAYSAAIADRLGNPINGNLKIYRSIDADWNLENDLDSDSKGSLPSFNLNNLDKYKLVYSSKGKIDSIVYVNPADLSLQSLPSNVDFGKIKLTNATIHSTILDKISERPIAGVTINIKETKENGEVVQRSIVSNTDGTWDLDYEATSRYDLDFSHPKYNTEKMSVLPPADPNDLNRILLTQLSKKGDKINIPNIYFDFNSSYFQKISYPILENIVTFLKDNPSKIVELSAHTDSEGDDKYNDNLSTKRAKRTYDYLIEHGIEPSRLTYKGYGERQLVNHCKNDVPCSREENEVNRRVELKIIKE